MESGAYGIDFLFFQVMPFGFGLFTFVGGDIIASYIIEEMFTDSTFETNQNKVELFCVMVSSFWFEIPIVYIVLESGTQEAFRKRRSR